MLQNFIEAIERLVEKLQTVPIEILYPSRSFQMATIEKIEQNFAVTKLIDRSFAQYLVQNHLLVFRQKLLLNFISFLSLIPFMLVSFLRYQLAIRKLKKSPHNTSLQHRQTAVFYEATNEVLPESLLNEFDCKIRRTGSFLSSDDIFEIVRICLKRPFSFYFSLKLSYKIAHYRYNFLKFSPKAMICSSEYSFTSSYMTQWCNNLDIEHINVMHGEKLFHMVDTFATFDRYYVWDNFYLELVQKLRCQSKNFFVEIPKRFNDYKNLLINTKNPTLTCFLQAKDLKSWQNLAAHLVKISSKYSISIRPHPRWLKNSHVTRIFADFKIENPRKVNIIDSIKNTNCVCSTYSTVLFLGHLAQREVIVDNISNTLLYAKLKELDFGVLQRPHKLLSEL